MTQTIAHPATLPAGARHARPEDASAPLVSVFVCTHNGGRTLRDSVLSVLEQTYSSLECIVVDDGSTDGSMATLEGLNDPRLITLRQPHLGKPAALNRALDAMRGDFFTQNDADDLSHPRRIELQVASMMEHPDVAAVFCGHELILDDRHVAPISPTRDAATCRRRIDEFRMPAHDPTAMFRMSIVKDMRFDTDLPVCSPYDYTLRVGEEHPMLVLGECLYSYRIHPDAMTRRDPAARLKYVVEVRKKACARRGWRYEDHACRIPSDALKQRREHDNNLAAHFMQSVCDLRERGRRWRAIKTGLQCAMLHPLSAHYHKAWVYSVIPMSMIRSLRAAS